MKPFIAQFDCKCDDCGEDMQRGSHCYIDDDSLICLDCLDQRENDNNLEQRYENTEEDN
jgi:hypothetical protein